MCHAARGSLIEPYCFHFHELRVFARRVHAKRSNQPQRPALQESLYVLTPDQRNVVAEPLAKCGEQAVPVRGLFLAHLLEHLRRRRVRFSQLVGKLPKNPSILFLVLNRQRQNLALRQILEFLEHSPPLRIILRRKNRTTSVWKSP